MTNPPRTLHWFSFQKLSRLIKKVSLNNNRQESFVLYSDKLRAIIFFFYLQILVICRFLKILIKRDKRIDKVSFNYNNCWQFRNSCFVVYPEFKNVLFYRVNGVKCNDFTKPIVLNLENYDKEIVDIVLYGFFHKKSYKLKIKPEAYIETDSFKILIQNLNFNDSIEIKPSILMPKWEIIKSTPLLFLNKININQNKIHLSFNPFNIEEYI